MDQAEEALNWLNLLFSSWHKDRLALGKHGADNDTVVTIAVFV